MSGRRREDFITEREHTKINQVPVGRGVSGRRREDFYYQEGAQKISLPVRGGWVRGRKCEDFVTGRWPNSRNVKLESTREKQNKDKQSKHKVLPSRHKVKFVSHPLPAEKKMFDSVAQSKPKQVKPETPLNPLPHKSTVPSHKYNVAR